MATSDHPPKDTARVLLSELVPDTVVQAKAPRWSTFPSRIPTSRFTLKSVLDATTQELSEVHAIFIHPDTASLWPPGFVLTEETCTNFIEKTKTGHGTTGVGYVVIRDTTVIGWMKMLGRQEGWPLIGFCVSPQERKRSVATETLHALFEEYSKHLGDEREIKVASFTGTDPCVIAWTSADNLACRKLLDKVGFEHIQTAWASSGDDWVESMCYRLDRS